MMTSIKGMIIIVKTMIKAIDICDIARVICTDMGNKLPVPAGVYIKIIVRRIKARSADKAQAQVLKSLKLEIQ